MEDVVKAPQKAESIEIILSPTTYPVAYKNRLEELIEQGEFDTREEAEEYIKTNPIVLELFYEKHFGLFAIDTFAVESEDSFSPYSRKRIVCDDDE